MAVPKRLYKYRSMMGDSRERTRRAIVDTEIYLPRCTEFNDPFDCRLNVSGLTEDAAIRQMEKATESLGIFCLSECNDNLLMWSHYTDGHRGLCLEYSTSDELLFGCSIDQVAYAPSYPELSVNDEINLDYVRKYLTTKAHDWNYEKEWRFITLQPGVQTAPPEELSAVILGCMISEEDRLQVIQWVKERSTPTRVYEAQRSEGAFRVEILPLKD